MIGKMKCAIALLSAVGLAALFAGCGNSAGNTPDAFGGGRPLVYASFYTMYDFAGKIGGDKIELHCMVPGGVEPHDWEPSARERSGLEKADMLIYSGVGFESWIAPVTAALDNASFVLVEASQGLEIHDLDDDEDDGHGHDHDGDPHVWLSIKNARTQLRTIHDALCALDPDNAAYYSENFAQHDGELDRLDAEFTRVLGECTRKEIVVTHAAFGYLCADYGIEQVSLRGYSPDGEPGGAAMTRIMDFCRERGVTTIFSESGDRSGMAASIAQELGITSAELCPLESLTTEQEKSGADYITIMQENLAALEAALR